MAGLGTRVYTDEMIHKGLANTLRSLGYDAESCEEAGRANQGIRDEDQLAYAAQAGRAMLTFNMGDFVRLDRVWKTVGWSHAGIIVSPALEDFGELLRRVTYHLDTYPPSVQHDTVLWLSNAPSP